MMNLDPRHRRAVTFWAEAQAADSRQQWNAAYDLYTHALAIYEELDDSRSVYNAYERLCDVTKHQKNWSQMAHYAKALLSLSSTGSWPNPWLFVGQAEHGCQNIDTARQALAECVRLSDIFVTRDRLNNEGSARTYTSDWFPQGLIYAEALHEWGLLEAAHGTTAEAVRLMALAELILSQVDVFETPYTRSNYAEFTHLRTLIAADRTRLENSL